MALLHHRAREERPWGSFERFTEGEPSTVKILRVAEGKRLSLQLHRRRSEFWRVIAGSGIVTVGEEERPARAGDEFEIPALTKHRLKGGSGGISVLEIAQGDFDENDIVRIEDDFGRAQAL